MSTQRITKGPEDRVDAGAQTFAAILRDCVTCGLVLAGPGDSVRILNAEASELLRQPLQSIQPLTAMPEPVRNAVARAIEGKPVHETALLQTASGERIQVGLWAAPAGIGGKAAILALNRVQALGQLEPDLQRMDRLVNTGIFSAGLAHEIKNALVPIKTFTDLLLEKHPDTELAEMVRRELGRVDSIVSRLLKFARPSTGTSAPVHMHETLEYALRLVQHHLQPGSIKVERSFGARTDTVLGDESQLHQAFTNLLMNAIEAMGPAGTLTVATENREDSGRVLRVSIRDTGPGVPNENLARLFEPFFTTKSNGTGLGLAVTRRIFAEHQGTISVESRLGQGTTFIVTLRVAD